MKRITVQVLLGLLMAVVARADTALTINSSTPFGCLQNAFLLPIPLQVDGGFTLPGVSGTGAIHSSINASAPTFSYPPEVFFFNYSIDLSGLAPAANHCVRLVIHFGAPQGCDTDEVWGSPAVIQSATLAPFGDISFVFAGGCLAPGQSSVGFTMFSEAAPKTNYVTIIDTYTDLASGHTNEVRINVPAIVPDIPPNPPPWVFYHPIHFPYAFFQGTLNNSNNPSIPFTNGFVNGSYDFTLQLLNSPSNGLAVSQVITQTVQVVNGLFNLPLPFDPISMGDGSARWLSLGVRQSFTGNLFSALVPAVQLTPTPQAFYAYTAGTVADLTPDQAVLSLNGITGNLNVQGGAGIQVTVNGDGRTLVISQTGQPSDRNIKTDFAGVKPEDILNKLLALPIESWRYTNEVAGVRHVGPMAQDFKTSFGLGTSDTTIGTVDEGGVALTAIQGLNEKVESGMQNAETQIDELKAENTELKQRLDKLELLMTDKLGGGK